MAEIVGPHPPLPFVPDDLTIPQFFLDSWHSCRPINKSLKPWFIDEASGRGITFEEIRARTFGLANAMKSRYGIGENDVVGVFSANHIDYAPSIWATHRLGAIVTAANPAYLPDELSYQLQVTKTKLLITHSGSLVTAAKAAQDSGISQDRIVLIDSPADNGQYMTLEALVQEGLSRPPTFVERRLNPGEAKTKLALLNFSSGTTGRPKAVAIPHISVISNVIQMALHSKTNVDYAPIEQQRYRPGDSAYAVLPWYHIYGLVVNLHFYLFAGFTLVVSGRFQFENMLKSIEKYQINHLLLVPPMIVLLCKNPATAKYNLSSLRFIMCGAAPLSGELTQQLVNLLPNAEVHQAYGMTETCTTVSWPRLDQRVGTLGCAGQIMPGITVRVIKEDGSLAKIGEQGELIIKTPSAALFYLNNEEATKDTFVDGWVKTGDEVIINELAELFVVDRRKEIMKVKGFQVAPAELEGHLLNHPDVADTCVVGVHDEYSGELPLAFVVLTADALRRIDKNFSESDKIKASIAKYVADHKVHYKRLAGGVVFIDAIPKNPSGKLLRRFLRDKANEMRNAASAVKGKL